MSRQATAVLQAQREAGCARKELAERDEETQSGSRSEERSVERDEETQSGSRSEERSVERDEETQSRSRSEQRSVERAKRFRKGFRHSAAARRLRDKLRQRMRFTCLHDMPPECAELRASGEDAFAFRRHVPPESLELRRIAKQWGLPLCDVEEIGKAFKRFDRDGSGVIELEEFRALLIELLNVRDSSQLSSDRLLNLWRHIDSDGSGEVDLEEFVLWYSRFFCPTGGANDGRSPIEVFYARMATDRLRELEA